MAYIIDCNTQVYRCIESGSGTDGSVQDPSTAFYILLANHGKAHTNHQDCHHLQLNPMRHVRSMSKGYF